MAVRPTYPATPHLRNACDACTTAKVRCSQGQSQCRRCENRGFLCQYSVSLRATKKARRPSSVSSSVPSGLNSTATSADHDGQETLDDVLMNSLSATSTNRVSSCAGHQITPFFDNDSLLNSFFEDCDPEVGNLNLQTGSPGSNEDTMPLFPNLLNLPQVRLSPKAPQATKVSQQAFNSHSNDNKDNNTNNNKRSHPNNDFAETASSSPPDHARTAAPPSTPPLSTPALTPTASAVNTIPLPQACKCQQLILSKLGDMSLRKTDHTIPFDQCLSENRSAITLCNTTVNCSNTHHDDDLVLMLTHLALIAHVTLFYDRPLGSQHKALDSPSEDGKHIHQSHPQHRAKSIFHHSNEQEQHQQRPPPPQRQQQQQSILPRVRLSLGTYELDTRDEQILQNNLLRIELSKIKSLMEAFERRFCTLEWMSGGVLGNDAAGMGGDPAGVGGSSKHGAGEKKPLGELIAWLKRRLRGNYEALAHWDGGVM